MTKHSTPRPKNKTMLLAAPLAANDTLKYRRDTLKHRRNALKYRREALKYRRDTRKHRRDTLPPLRKRRRRAPPHLKLPLPQNSRPHPPTLKASPLTPLRAPRSAPPQYCP